MRVLPPSGGISGGITGGPFFLPDRIVSGQCQWRRCVRLRMVVMPRCVRPYGSDSCPAPKCILFCRRAGAADKRVLASHMVQPFSLLT